jgi:predicted TPR repeat methyltransferase
MSLISFINADVFQKLMDDYYLLYRHDNKVKYELFINEFFAYISGDYENIIDTNRNCYNIKNLETIVNNKLPDSNKLKILDFGCGTGLSVGVISDKHELVGVDSCEMMLQKARSRGLNAFNNNELNIKYNSKYFDAIISSYVFHLIEDMSTLDLVWEKLRNYGLFVGNFHKNKNLDIFVEYFREKCHNISLYDENFYPENGRYVIVIK